MGLTSEQEKNAPIAFALVCGAGLSTALGASVVFFPALVKLASRRVLAGALGISAGVMTYVSFVEIFGKSQGSFQEAGFSEKESYTYATLCFFGGVVVMLVSTDDAQLDRYGNGVFVCCPVMTWSWAVYMYTHTDTQRETHTHSLSLCDHVYMFVCIHHSVEETIVGVSLGHYHHEHLQYGVHV